MRFKLDENFDLRLTSLVAAGGHAVDTALAEGLSGTSDERVYQACRDTGRTLITLDLDFSNPLRFPPDPTEGIVVLRPPRPTLPLIRVTLTSVLPDLKSRSLRGTLVIAEPARIRLYNPREQREPQ
jgi:predicted nuclease of predicted toxin-antitoxin system